MPQRFCRTQFMHLVLRIGLTAVIPALSAERLVAQETDKSPMIATFNPAGFLQFGPTLEVEFPASPAVGLAFGVRVPTLGLLAHVIDPDIRLAVLGMGALRFHTDSRKPLGWWWGPRAEAGVSNSAGTNYSVYGGGIEVGHNRRLGSGRLIALGGIAGMFKSTGGLSGAFVMGVFSVGLGKATPTS